MLLQVERADATVSVERDPPYQKWSRGKRAGCGLHPIVPVCSSFGCLVPLP